MEATSTPLKERLARNVKGVWFLVAVMTAVTVMLVPMDLSEEEKRVLAVVAFTLVLFITSAVPLAVAGLMGCFGFWTICGLPFGEAFSGFSSSTPWFIFGALLIGLAAAKTRIPQRLAYRFIGRAAPSYAVLLGGMIVLDLALTVIMPSGAPRVVILCSMAVGLVHGFGLDIKSNVARGMILVLTFAATIFDKTILAGAASILSRGIIEGQTGEAISWSQWFVAYAPVNIIVMAACWLFTLKMFPPEVKRFGEGESRRFAQEGLDEIGPVTSADKRGIALVALATLLWATDALHGIPAEVVGIGIGLAAFVPKVGILGKEDLDKVNFPVVVFVGAALSMSGVLVDTSTLTDALSGLFSWLVPLAQNDHLLSLGLYLLANVFHLFLGSEPAMLAASMPLVMNFAASNALNPEAVGMIWTFAAGGKLFVYQSAILALGHSYGAFSLRDLFKMGLALIAVEAVCVAVVVPAYWSLIGVPLR